MSHVDTEPSMFFQDLLAIELSDFAPLYEPEDFVFYFDDTDASDASSDVLLGISEVAEQHAAASHGLNIAILERWGADYIEQKTSPADIGLPSPSDHDYSSGEPQNTTERTETLECSQAGKKNALLEVIEPNRNSLSDDDAHSARQSATENIEEKEYQDAVEDVKPNSEATLAVDTTTTGAAATTLSGNDYEDSSIPLTVTLSRNIYDPTLEGEHIAPVSSTYDDPAIVFLVPNHQDIAYAFDPSADVLGQVLLQQVKIDNASQDTAKQTGRSARKRGRSTSAHDQEQASDEGTSEAADELEDDGSVYVISDSDDNYGAPTRSSKPSGRPARRDAQAGPSQKTHQRGRRTTKTQDDDDDSTEPARKRGRTARNASTSQVDKKWTRERHPSPIREVDSMEPIKCPLGCGVFLPPDTEHEGMQKHLQDHHPGTFTQRPGKIPCPLPASHHCGHTFSSNGTNVDRRKSVARHIVEVHVKNVWYSCPKPGCVHRAVRDTAMQKHLAARCYPDGDPDVIERTAKEGVRPKPRKEKPMPF